MSLGEQPSTIGRWQGVIQVIQAVVGGKSACLACEALAPLKKKKLGVVVHTCSPSAWQVKLENQSSGSSLAI